jgi:hypothetical protein
MAAALRADRAQFAPQKPLNTAASGMFCADRAVNEYAKTLGSSASQREGGGAVDDWNFVCYDSKSKFIKGRWASPAGRRFLFAAPLDAQWGARAEPCRLRGRRWDPPYSLCDDAAARRADADVVCRALYAQRPRFCFTASTPKSAMRAVRFRAREAVRGDPCAPRRRALAADRLRSRMRAPAALRAELPIRFSRPFFNSAGPSGRSR